MADMLGSDRAPPLACSTRPKTTTNQYSLLSKNEWLRYEDSCENELVSCEKDDSKNVGNTMDVS